MRHLVLAAALVAGTAGTRQDPAVIELTAAAPVEETIAPGEEHRFRLTLGAGQYASIAVAQHGIDVEAIVRDAQGRLLADFQDEIRSDGDELVEVVADADAALELIVRAPDGAARSGTYVMRMTPARPAIDAERRMWQVRALHSRARQQERSGQYESARATFEQTLSAVESVRGTDDPYVAEVLFELAGNALERQDNAASAALYGRAIDIFDRRWGRAHPYPAMARSRLALLEQRAGQPARAEAAIRAVLPLLETALGKTHPWYMQSLLTFANLRATAGDLAQAEQIDRDALAVVETTHRTGTILHASLLNNLADIFRMRHDLTAAEDLYRQSLAIGERVVGGESLFVATALQNLGVIARERKQYAEALASYRRALSIREQRLGPDHPAVASVLVNLANVYRATGNDAMALETQFRALAIWERTMGPYGRETLLVVGNIARTYAGSGDLAQALLYQRRADAILETQMSLYLAMGSERQKLAFVRAQSERTDRTLSLHLRQAPEDAAAASLAALVLLQRKGRVQDVMTDMFASVRAHDSDAGHRSLLDQLRETMANLARIALGAAATGADVRETLARLESRKEQLEAALSERSAEFRTGMQPVSLERIQAAIPGDAALIEFAVFRPFDPGAERNEEAYGPPHYAAYVIARHGTPLGIDLGAVEDIDPLIVRLREALRDPAITDVKARARALDERILQPLRASLNGATRLLVSPDRGLNLVPFEALVDEHGRYVIERYATTYLTSGRDLLRMAVRRTRPGAPVIVADPLFGEPTAVASAAVTRARGRDSRGSITAGPASAELYFAPLSGTGLEGRAIKSLFPDALLLTGRRASKTTLERVTAPRILHIASHGFFLDDDQGPGSGATPQNPLLRSGLALAGANLPGAEHGRGILTSLEASSLNLWGTRLVTLSACDTGVGEIRNGEGVYGLRRAFTLAGSETLVMTLWPVTDAIARDTMVAYYARLRDGMGRGDALRQAKLSILKRPALRHPYYWGGFIQSGDWSRLPDAH